MALTQDELDQVYNYVMGKGQSLSGLPDGGTDLSSMYLAPLLKYSPGSAATLVRLAVSLLKGDSAYQVWVNEPGNAGKTLSDFFAFIKGAKGDPFTFADFTPEQLVDLALTYDKLTPEQKEEMKLKFADLTEADILALQKPATDAAAEMRQEMVQISQNANAAIEAANTAAGNAQDAADNVQDGKTPILESVNAQSGNIPSGSFSENGVDASGNPKYILNLTLPAGKDGQPAIFEQGTTTTVEPNGSASVEVVENGTTPEGNPKYILNFSIPRGQQGPPGAGSGNVSADGTGLVIGKKYLFVPDADDSTAGSFVEYEAPEIPEQVQPDWDATEGKGAILNKPGNATADTSGLMSADQFQKLEKVSPDEYVKKAGDANIYIDKADPAIAFPFKGTFGYTEGMGMYIYNHAREKSLEYTDAGKLLFEGKEAFAVDADNELTLAGKKLSDLGGGAQYLDLSPLLDAEGNPVTTVTDEFLAQVEDAYNNHVTNIYLDGSIGSMLLVAAPDYYRIAIMMIMTTSNNKNGINDGVLAQQEFLIYKADKSVLLNIFASELKNTGDGTKFKSDDGTYKEVGGSDFVEIPFAVLELTNSSTSDQIKTAFGGDTAFDNIHSKIKGGKMAYSIFNVEEAGITMTIPFVADGGMADAETKALQLMYINPLLQKPEHVNLIINKSIAGNTYTAMSVTNQLSYDLATTGSNGLMSATDKTKIDRLRSYTTATTVASLNVNYEVICVTLSANASLSVSGTETTYNGRTITAYVYTASARTITIPTSGSYISMCGSSYTTKADKWVEFNLTYIAGVWHIAKLEQE